MKYAEGNVYEGEFVADKREGRGKLIFNTGDKYEGGFKNDL